MFTSKICGTNGYMIKYEWMDELGTHQYYIDAEENMECGECKNYKIERISNATIYSWNDNYGFHQYIVENEQTNP